MDIKEILLKYWGYSSFRPLQEDIINQVLDDNDCLALLPTGGGKSICFQVPALAKEGLCIVVSPLIALMKDQVENLLSRKINASAIYSGMSKREIDITLDNCVYGKTKFLYVSPERLTTTIFIERVKKMNVNLIAVDEAHCISQWGYDFRPSYLNIKDLREILPNTPILAVTATATPEVVIDIQKQLDFKQELVLQKSFERKNLSYVVLNEENKLNRLIKILNTIKGTSVVYVRTRKQTKEIASFLQKNNISSDYYHAGLTTAIRSKKQNNWINNITRVMVATNAFGMGIDKPNVRTVIHLNLPDSLEAYFQEAGRAGRDEKKAYAILLTEKADRLDLEQRITNSFPPIEQIKKTYQALANYFQLPIGSGLNESFQFNLNEFCERFNYHPLTVYNCLNFLERENYLVLTQNENSTSKLLFTAKKNDLYEVQVKNRKLDGLIKTIMRSYGGAFDHYIKINETDIAKRLSIDVNIVEQLLHQLIALNIADYIPKTNLPSITYTTERLATERVTISKASYHTRKEIAVKKMESVVYYAFSNHKCRSEILLNYFGEKDVYRCGVCDVCLERNKLDLSDYEFTLVSKQAKELLNNNNLSLTELINSIKEIREDKTIKVIQWLIENNKIVEKSDNTLRWKK